MSCNSCTKGYSILRPEVCAKCKRSYESQQINEKKVIPPDTYYKRIAAASNNPSTSEDTNVDEQIQARLKKLKEKETAKLPTEDELAKRLQGIKGEIPKTSDAELRSRLAKLKGMPDIDTNAKAVLPAKDLRTEQEQADDLIKQYLAQTQIDCKYKDEFDNLISDMESRMQRLKGSSIPGKEQGLKGSIPGKEQGLKDSTPGNEQGLRGSSELASENEANVPNSTVESEDEDEAVRKIVEKIKSEATDDELSVTANDELPFCEICNEDARMRCVGCRYLFCKRCFVDHRDDDDGCNRYEPYEPPRGSHY